MTLQLITKDEETCINLEIAEVVSNNSEKIIVLVNIDSITDKNITIIEKQTGFLFSFDPSQDLITTKSHFIKTSTSAGGSMKSLTESQWLIEFSI